MLQVSTPALAAILANPRYGDSDDAARFAAKMESHIMVKLVEARHGTIPKHMRREDALRRSDGSRKNLADSASQQLQEMDIALWCYNKNMPANELAKVLEIAEEQAAFIYKDIEAKRKTTAPLHWPAILIEPVDLGL